MITFLGNDTTREKFEWLIEESSKDTKDIVVSCQYPYKIPKTIINNNVCVNLHFGKLPYYAGMYPVFWQIINGEEYAWITLHYMDNTFDSGDIIGFAKVEIGNKTADEVYNDLTCQAPLLLKKFYKKILKGTAPRIKQNLSQRRYYNKDSVNFDSECVLKFGTINVRELQAFHFKGKQYPTLKINDRFVEMRFI